MLQSWKHCFWKLRTGSAFILVLESPLYQEAELLFSLGRGRNGYIETKESVSELLITKKFFSHSLFQTCQACGVWSTFRDFSGELSRSSANTPGWCTEGTMSESLNWIASFSSLDSSVPMLLLNCSSGPSSALSAWMIWCWKCSVRLYKGIYTSAVHHEAIRSSGQKSVKWHSINFLIIFTCHA